MPLPHEGSVTSIYSYPGEIEDWWWRKANEKWPDATDSHILRLLREEITVQSDLFNKERDFSRLSYGSRDLSILAYGNFFFPRTWMQNTFVLAEAIDLRGWKPPRKGPLRILDLGSGSGPAGLAALRLLRERGVANPIELRAVDYSGKSLSYLRNIHAANGHLWPRTNATTKRSDLSKPLPENTLPANDFILLSSSLNEIAGGTVASSVAQHLAGISKLLKPSGFLMVVEPALKAICQSLHQAAALLAESAELWLHGPYFNGAPCPLASSKSRYHSHEVRRRNPPETVRRLNEPLGLAIRDLKFSFIILGRKAPVPFDQGPSVMRLVSPVTKRKGTYHFIGIGGDAKERAYEIQIRDLNDKGRNFIERLERGDVLRLLEWETFRENRLIRIPSAENIEILWSPN